MGANSKRNVRAKRGNIELAMVVVIMILALVTCMGRLAISTEAFRLRNIDKVSERYQELSMIEVAGFEVITNINGVYLDGLSEDDLANKIKASVLSLLEKEVQVKIENNIEISNSIQVKMMCGSDKNPVATITGIELIEETKKESGIETIRYLIDCSNCVVERAVSYV